MKTKLPLSDALFVAERLVDRLSIYCQRIEIAGSVRRKKSGVGDIELVAIPRFETDLFGASSDIHLLDVFDWECVGRIVKGGHKYKQIELEEGVNLDLFIVTPPAQWGVQFMIRTGSAEFSHRLVTPRKHGGLMPSNYRVKDGAIWSNSHIIATPEEQDVFDLIGIPFIDPVARTK